MNTFKNFAIGVIAATFLGSSPAARATLTGDPFTDGWAYVGNSAAAGNYNSNSTVPPLAYFSADMYTTLFTLASGSPLLSTLGGFDWSAGDSVVGVGGVFNPAGDNATLTDSYGGPGGATDIRFVVKYGTSAATWEPYPTSTIPGWNGTATQYGSLANGGPGSILLGTSANQFYPADSGQLTVPSDSPEEQTGVATTASIIGDIGRVVTDWSGGAVVGFESFLDLTLLGEEYPTASIAAGDPFILDLQDNSSEFQLSQADLPRSAIAVPDHARTIVLLALATGAIVTLHRLAIRPQSPV